MVNPHSSTGSMSLTRKRILLLMGSSLLIAFLFTSIAGFFVSRNSIRDSIISRELPLTSDTIYSEIQRDLLLPLNISSTMAHDTFLRNWVISGEKNEEEITRYLAEIRDKYSTISSFFVSDKTRTYYHADGILKKINPHEARDAWYFRVAAMEAPYEINVDPDAANKDTITIFINYKVFDFEGNFIGATGVGLTVRKIIERINYYQDHYQRSVYFIDEAGNILLTNWLQDDVEKQSIGNIRENSGLVRFANDILTKTQSAIEYEYEGRNILLHSRYIEELNWILMVEQSDAASIAPVRRMLIINLAISAGITLILLTLVYVTIGRYQQRLEYRNSELEYKNEQIEEQHRQLTAQTDDLARVNDRLKELNQEKNEYLSIAAHDLKSPLNGISGFAEMILEMNSEELNEENRRHLNEIRNIAFNMSDLITNLLDISVIESSDKVIFDAIELNQIIESTEKQFLPIAKAKGISIISHFPDQSLIIKGNNHWLHQIVENLLSNAVKYSPEGNEVTLHLMGREDAAIITITDKGPGLTQEDKQSVFQKFSRLSAKPTGEESSTGLGLYIVKKMTESMGGKVSLESEPGLGASFSVTFPLLKT